MLFVAIELLAVIMGPLAARAAKAFSSDLSGNSSVINAGAAKTVKSPNTIAIDANTVDYKSAWLAECEVIVIILFKLV